MLRKIRMGEVVDHFQTVRRRKDGTLLEISLTVSPIRKGVGLGLALSRHVIELHGGVISVRSDGPGQGTEFWLELPKRPAFAPKALRRGHAVG